MKKVTLTAALFAIGAFAESWSGTITDASCGAKHADASEASQACSKRCFDRSHAAVLVSGDTVVKIDTASNDKIANFVGQKVILVGTVKDGTVTVDSVKVAD